MVWFEMWPFWVVDVVGDRVGTERQIITPNLMVDGLLVHYYVDRLGLLKAAPSFARRCLPLG